MGKTYRFHSLLILLFLLISAGCQQHIPTDPRPTWERFFVRDDRLVGVKVQQHPDNGDIESHKGKHPAMVLYVLSKSNQNRVCQVGFSPEGDVHHVFWWGPPEEWIMEQLKPRPSQE